MGLTKKTTDGQPMPDRTGVQSEMDIYEIRRENYLALLEEHFEDKVVELHRASGINRTMLSRYKKHPSESKKNRIGPNVARRIETAAGKPRGWLDQPSQSIGQIIKEKSHNYKVESARTPILEGSNFLSHLKGETPENVLTVPQVAPGVAPNMVFAFTEQSTQFEPAINKGAIYHVTVLPQIVLKDLDGKMVACYFEPHLVAGRIKVLSMGEFSLQLPDGKEIPLDSSKKQVVGIVTHIGNP